LVHTFLGGFFGGGQGCPCGEGILRIKQAWAEGHNCFLLATRWASVSPTSQWREFYQLQGSEMMFHSSGVYWVLTMCRHCSTLLGYIRKQNKDLCLWALTS
jgi:hypothetical protein